MRSANPLFSMLWAVAMAAAALSACSSDENDGTGQMKLAVADAPVDGAEAVIVKFTGVELLNSAGDDVTITFATPKTIDLLNDSGTASAVLFDQPIPSGSYSQVRLLVEADGDPVDSYITLSDGTDHGLRVPSGNQTGLKLVSGFNVPDGGIANYTVDFDLRKAITCPPGQNGVCLLKPALRLVNNTAVGNIQGIVDATLVPEGCTPGVYLYSGTVTEPEDMDSTSATPANQPMQSKVPVVNDQSAGGYYYQMTFLEPGSYTAAFTCQAAVDNPDQADAAVTFAPIESGITVTAGQTTAVDIP